MQVIEFRGRVISRGRVLGKALLSRKAISFYGGVDPETAVVIEKGHPLEGKSIADKILIFPYGKGSTVGSYIIYRLAKMKIAPKAFVCIKAEPIVSIGAIISGIPLIDSISEEIFNVVKNGDKILVDCYNGLVRCFK